MALETRPLLPHVGVEIMGVDVRGVDDATFAQIVDAFNEQYRRVMHRTTVAGDGPTADDVRDADVAPARDTDVVWGRAQLEVV